MANYTTTLPDGADSYLNADSRIAPNGADATAYASGGLSAAGGQPAAQPGAQVEADGSRSEPQLASAAGIPLPQNLGPDNELLEQAAPRLVNALRELVVLYRQEGLVARRHEIRRIRQARLFWQGLQYAWWNPQDMNWHLPFEAKIYDDTALEDMPRYQFVTNLYQAFGLSFVSVISQDVPATRFYPQSTLIDADITTAKAASEVAKLIEQNNHVEKLLTGAGFYLWTDGKIGGYVRYVADGQRFGWRDELVLTERWVKLGQDAYVCPRCHAETEIGAEHDLAGSGEAAAGDASASPNAQSLGSPAGRESARPEDPSYSTQRGDASSGTGTPAGAPFDQRSAHSQNYGEGVGVGAAPFASKGAGFDVNVAPGFSPAAFASQNGSPIAYSRAGDAASPLSPPANAGGASNNFLTGAICPHCGAALGPADFRPAPRVPVPIGIGTRRVPNGQEVISIVGGLELNTPVWANEQHEFPYLQWQMEVHRAKLKAAFPHAADKIQTGGESGADDIYARATRIAVAQGMPTTHPGDALFNLVTFSRTWIRPWAFYAIEDKSVRDALLQLFPDGCYVAFAGDTYCESRNECMDDCWRVMHALPGDGQNRPSVGESLIDIQERYNALSNIQAETYEYGIPPIYADPQVLDFDALQGQTAEPAAHYPARARPGMSLADGFFQPAPAQVPPDMQRHQQDLIGPIAQFLTGLFPAVFGGEMENVKTASGYAMARDQALGRLGLVWRRLKQFYSDVMLLSVDCFRKNRPNDVEMPFLGAGGQFEAKFIRLADLKGNIQAHPESDETFPRLKSQQRAVLQQLMTNPDPTIQAALREPANLGFIKSLIGLSELVVPGDDAREKQLREIQQLLLSPPLVVHLPRADSAASDSAPAGGTADSSGLGTGPQNDTVAGSPQGSGSVIPSEVAGRSSSRSSGRPATQSRNPSSGFDSQSAATEPHLISTIPVDEMLDDHATEFEECRRWASSDAGQIARAQNPAGFANVRAHAAEHAAAMARQQLRAALISGAASGGNANATGK